ncbi:hypothetical protein [Paraburkholderia sp. CNPSo 3281]|uniref:hypothetical protein n=1 Tax=Paraburkholderia sp. CNPSo 3281 TaxID=2940933 RepID=UPI0020B7ADD2|nr:hypothetical protein [Paraburkholderia sp. CNPSo 3281]MCP3715550.1 hypothetical protein [Paraburkholderia sp. CNPSo 3281]
MNFGLLLPHLSQLQQTQDTLHPDVLGARERPAALPEIATRRALARPAGARVSGLNQTSCNGSPARMPSRPGRPYAPREGFAQ